MSEKKEPERATEVEKVIGRVKSHPLVAILLAASTVIVALGTLTNSIDRIVIFFTPPIGRKVAPPQAVGAPVSPTTEEFAQAMIGTTIPNTAYEILSENRFRWNSEAGNWTYTKQGETSGKLVFTYDGNNNLPSVYREEILLNYDGSKSGRAVYSEYNYEEQDPSTVKSSPFRLD